MAATLQLGDVRDVYAVCRKVLDDKLRNLGAYLPAEDREDAIQFLAMEAVKAHRKYDPTVRGWDGRSAEFKTYLYAVLERRVVDYYRQRFGRGGAHRAPAGSRSLDELDAPGRDRALPTTPDDDGADAALAIERLSPEARYVAHMLRDGYSRVEIARHTGRTTRSIALVEGRIREEVVWLGR